MGTLISQIINKYQGSAPQQVIHAVEKAAARTGADFSFLMEKASAESGFNPTAKAKSSSATGLFQFIDSTWLHMVKEYGAKYGLGKLADQIQIKNGKACVDDCKTKDAILNLRKNPEISALMAGEFSAQNKQYLKEHTEGGVGATELYLAHFMGASGAAKLLNSRDENGNAAAAQLFPKEARANKNVFFNPATGAARTLNDLYDFFAQKFNSGTTPSPSAPPAHTLAEAGSIPPAPARYAVSPLMLLEIAQAPLPSGDIFWNDGTVTRSGFSRSAAQAPQKLSAESIMILAQMQKHAPHIIPKDEPVYNS